MIVQQNASLAGLWKRHLQRMDTHVTIVDSEQDAIDALLLVTFRVIILDLSLESGGAFTVSDFAHYRQPDARVIFVSNTAFFSDGSIFKHCGNARAFLPAATKPDDLAAMVEHYATY
nr:hypothetical protein [Cognatishimia sp. F0-27]